jgi:hypothetical protein
MTVCFTASLLSRRRGTENLWVKSEPLSGNPNPKISMYQVQYRTLIAVAVAALSSHIIIGATLIVTIFLTLLHVSPTHESHLARQ